MKKYLFLDIDGVIATPESVKHGLWALVDSKQQLLDDILKKTGAKIVLSSSWRKHTLLETKEYMNEKGFWFTEEIVGVTIRAYQYIEKGIHLSMPRGVEIKQWIDCNIHSEQGKNWNKKKLGQDYQYAILDDDTDMLVSQNLHFVKCNPFTGLEKIESQLTIDILNSDIA